MGYLLDKLTEKPASKSAATLSPELPTARVAAGKPPFKEMLSPRPRAGAPIGAAGAKAVTAAGSWGGIKPGVPRKIPAGQNESGDKMIYSGAADPLRFLNSKDPKYQNPAEPEKDTAPPPTKAGVVLLTSLAGGWGNEGQITAPGVPEADIPTANEIGFKGPLLWAGQVMNDVHSRIRNLRKDVIDDPMKRGDEPRFEYTPPAPGSETYKGPRPRGANGKKGDPGDVEDYWTLEDGSVASTADINAAVKNPIRDFSGAIVAYGMKDKATGKTRIIPPGYIALGAPKFLHSAFPDGTRFSLADGSIPPELANVLKRQTNPGFFSLGVKDPRAPWLSAAGDSLFDKSYWDRVTADDRPMNNPWDFAVNAYDNVKDTWGEQSTVNEAIPFAIDMGLGSIPYMVDKKRRYGTLAALAAASPYSQGTDGDTAQPTGRFLDNWQDIGNTKYIDTDLTNAQLLAGQIEPMAANYLETAMGRRIGGLDEKLMKFFPDPKSKARKFLSGGAAKVGGGFLTEGLIEEAPLVPFQMIEQSGLEHYGLTELGVNDKTGEMEYDHNSSPLLNTLGNMGNATGAGGVMGGLFDAIPALKADWANRSARGPAGWRRGKTEPVQSVPVNPKRTQAQLDAEMKALERRYGEGEAQ
jgi:hypothetical protein